MDPFVSVVTPFHNTAPYLAECIESVLRQDYRPLEYVLVDNQSTDGSGEIAARYAAKDSRIRLIRSDRLRAQIENYNFALQQMTPEARYCKVAQADDWLFPHCLTDMVALAEAHPTAALVSAYDLRDAEVFEIGLHANETFLRGLDAARLYLAEGIHLFGSPTTVLYRADVVRERPVFYEPGRLHPDTEVALEILTRYDFAFVHQVLSFLRQQEDSVTGRVKRFAPEGLDRLISVKRYGPRYLQPDAYQRCVRAATIHYYKGLALCWERTLGRPGRAFWEYHRAGLQTIDEKIRWDRLARALATNALEALENPGNLFARVRRGLRTAAKPGQPVHPYAFSA